MNEAGGIKAALSLEELEAVKQLVNCEEYKVFVKILDKMLAKVQSSVILYDYMGGTDRELSLLHARLDGYRKLTEEIRYLKQSLS